MNVLVSGGAGFIGSHIVDAYIDAGHEVTIVDNMTTGAEANINPRAEMHVVDIRDRDAIDALFDAKPYDLVNHHAAQLDVRVSVRDPQFDAAQNVIGSLNLFEAARRTGVKRIVFASTGGAVYGEQEYFPADENHPTNPISPYGVTKLSVEKYLHYYHTVHGIDTLIFRYTNVYGPRQNPHGEAGVIAIFCDRMVRGAQPVINGDGGQTRDYLFVEDLVRAHMLGLDYLAAKGSGTFNLCTATETTVNELFHILDDLLGGSFLEQHAPAQPGEQRRSVCSYQKAKQILGWSPVVSVAEGLRRTVDPNGTRIYKD